jgi:hypothetical protein
MLSEWRLVVQHATLACAAIGSGYRQRMNAAPRRCVCEIFRDQSLVVTYSDYASTADQWREYTAMMCTFHGHGATRFFVFADAPPPG